ncbi:MULTISPECIES: DUF4124 domain-containing protein [unclassified Acinetobacter]|uniref:DUF4124 domain-containing protein n=1 Tax=unclassified Acinetobacter TaxID=196816 RepID=UPI0035B736DB
MVIFTLASTSIQAQSFYKWVDASGSTHYTTTPPPKNARKQGVVNTINDTPSGTNYRPSVATPAPENNTTATPESITTTPAAEPTRSDLPAVALPPNAPVNKGERMALPPRVADPTAGINAPIR